MAVTFATITGTIKHPDTETGVRCRVTAVPLTESLGIATSDGLLYGVVIGLTDDTGALLEPLNLPVVDGVVWSLFAEPLNPADRGGPGNAALKRWNFFNGEVTASTTLHALADTVPTALTADFPSALVVQAQQAAVDAADSAAAAAAVGATSDAQQANNTLNGPLTKAALSASFAPLLTFPVAAPTGVAATDTASIKTAVAAAVASGGGLVQLGRGLYLVNTYIPLRANVTLAGVSRDLTTIKLADGANCNVLDYPNGSQTNVEARDFTVDGNLANQTSGDGRGLQFVLTTQSRARRLRVINTRGQGINVYQGSDFTVSDCVVTGSGKAGTTDGHGIYATGVARFRATENLVRNCLECGILAPDCVDTVISNNTVTDIGFIGIGLGAGLACKNVTINGNTIARCGDNAIDTGEATGTTVTGNSMSDCFDGIDADLSGLTARTNAALVFSNNKIKNCGRYGIIVGGPVLYGVHNVTVSGNSIDSVQQHAICLAAVREATVSANVVRNPSKLGVGFAGIRMDGASVGNQGVAITGNRIYEDGTSQCYAIDRGTGGAGATANNYNVYLGNITRSCLAGFAGSAGPNDVQASNI